MLYIAIRLIYNKIVTIHSKIITSALAFQLEGHDGLESVKDESIGLTAGGRAVWSPKGIAVHGI